MKTNNTALTPESLMLTDRAKKAKRINKLTITAIAEESGMRYLAVQRQLNGLYNLDIRVLLAIARLCPNISAEWLLRGKGDILIGEPDSNLLEERLARLESLLKDNKDQ